MNALFILSTFFFLIFMKVPIAFAMLLASGISLYVLNLGPLTAVPAAAMNALFSFPLLTIPFFIFAGSIMAKGGMARKLCVWCGTIFNRFRGGPGYVAVASSVLFSTMTGSASATCASIGQMMLPEMEKSGYRRPRALAVIASGGVLGPVIPPSVMFVLYGVASGGVSITSLFMAGIIPGILLGLLLCVTVYLVAKKDGMEAEGGKFSASLYFRTMWDAKWAIMTPGIILGGIYSGIFTPTEAGAVASVFAIIVTVFIEKSLDWKGLISCAADSAVTGAIIFLLISAAGVFGRVLTLAQVPQQVTEGILGIAQHPWQALLLINIVLLLLGCVMDGAAAIIILTPLLLPVATYFGIDPIHFGLIICLNLSLSAVTPPVGTALFVSALIGETPLEKVVKEIWPFIGALFLGLLLINAVPWFSLALIR